MKAPESPSAAPPPPNDPDPSKLVAQTGRALDLVPYLADHDLVVHSVAPGQPGPGYVTVAVRQDSLAPAPMLVVGEQHSPAGSGAAFSGSGPSASRLARLLGDPVLDVAMTANLLEQGAPWDTATARAAAGRLVDSWDGWIVACGRRVATAFSLSDVLVWHGRLGAIPHPSGRCRTWNDPAWEDATSLFLRPAVDSARLSALAPAI